MIEQVQQLNERLEQSNANDSFKEAVINFVEGHETNLIKYSLGSPRIKIVRVLMKLLEEFHEEPISYVNIQASSDCSRYYGSLIFGPNNTKVKFDWDCGWKAEQEGFRTWYGQPDQLKAAELFGYQCFREFKLVE